MTVSAPRWDLTNVYPALESKEFQNAVKKYKKMLDELETFLAKKVIVEHGGEVLFESVEGKGSTFGFTLPIKKLAVSSDEKTDQPDQ